VGFRKLIEKEYLLYKNLGGITSLLLAFIYSDSLGIVNRSILTYVLVLSTLIWIALSSGSTLTLRKLKPDLKSVEFKSFLGLVYCEMSIGFALFTSGLLLYSLLEVQIPFNFFLLSLVYFLVAGIISTLIEVLISRLQFVYSAKIEFGCTLLQLVFFFLLKQTTLFTLGVVILLSFIASYFFACCLIALKLKVIAPELLRPSNPILFLHFTKGNHTLGISIAILDRLDKVFIAFIFPLGTLAPYSIFVSLISLFRTFPDYLSRLIISHKVTTFASLIWVRVQLVCIYFSLLVGMVLVSRSLVFNSLGKDWVVPIAVGFTIALHELFRGMFQIRLNELVSRGSKAASSFFPILALVCIPPALLLVSLKFGLVGVPLTYVMVYGLILGISYHRKFNNV
jgi:hypothetical protein